MVDFSPENRVPPEPGCPGCGEPGYGAGMEPAEGSQGESCCEIDSGRALYDCTALAWGDLGLCRVSGAGSLSTAPCSRANPLHLILVQGRVRGTLRDTPKYSRNGRLWKTPPAHWRLGPWGQSHPTPSKTSLTGIHMRENGNKSWCWVFCIVRIRFSKLNL